MPATGTTPAAPGSAPPAPSPARYLTVSDVAAMLRVSPSAVDVWARDGCNVAGRVVRLNGVRAGVRRLFRPEDVERFVSDCTAAHEAGVASCAPDRPAVADVDKAAAAFERALGRRR